MIVCSVPQNRFFMYRSSLKARTLNVLAFKDEHVLLLTSHKLKWYFDDDQFTATIIFSFWVWAKFVMKIFLTQTRMCLYYRFTTFCLLWLSWINASLSTMSHYFPYAIAIILFVSCTIVFSKTKGINLIHSFRTIVQQRKQHSTSQEILL